jgi:riboflavin-specific deaminase-like protein
MISSADGKATVEGRSGELGSATDRELFLGLRTQVDAILVGSGTLRAERYGRFVRDPALRDRRVHDGFEPDPLGVVVTRSLRVPVDIPLFEDSDSTVAVYTASEQELPPCAATVLTTHLPEDELTMTSVLRRLRAEHDVRSVLCEGGPTVLAALLAENVADELFLTLAPKLVGGRDELPTVAGTGLPEPVTLELTRALEIDGYLFLRYRVRR